MYRLVHSARLMNMIMVSQILKFLKNLIITSLLRGIGIFYSFFLVLKMLFDTFRFGTKIWGKKQRRKTTAPRRYISWSPPDENKSTSIIWKHCYVTANELRFHYVAAGVMPTNLAINNSDGETKIIKNSQSKCSSGSVAYIGGREHRTMLPILFLTLPFFFKKNKCCYVTEICQTHWIAFVFYVPRPLPPLLPPPRPFKTFLYVTRSELTYNRVQFQVCWSRFFDVKFTEKSHSRNVLFVCAHLCLGKRKSVLPG